MTVHIMYSISYIFEKLFIIDISRLYSVYLPMYTDSKSINQTINKKGDI